MMPVEVHAESLKRRFVAPLLSIACLLNLLIVLGAAVLPLYIAWATRLWQKEALRHEQLGLTYKSSVLVQLQGLKGKAGEYRAPFTAMWSTSPAANELMGADVLRGMVLKSSFPDWNQDGLGDELRLTVSAHLADDETVHAATIVAFVDARLVVRASWRCVAAPAALPARARPLTARPHPHAPRTPRRTRRPSAWTRCWRRATAPPCPASAWCLTAT